MQRLTFLLHTAGLAFFLNGTGIRAGEINCPNLPPLITAKTVFGTTRQPISYKSWLLSSLKAETP